jgi:hypothetical protein
MPYPTPSVQIAFNASPYDVSPFWTDVTDFVRELSINRGRNGDWEDFYGSAEVVLNNRTRLFDPYNTSGVYYGKLLPRLQIRIRATTNDGGSPVTHDVFRGFISGWNPSWTDAGTDSTVTLSCFDALQLLGSEQLPPDLAAPYILSLSPRHYWKMDDPVSFFNTSTIPIQDYGTAPLALTGSTNITEPGPQLAVGLPSSSIQGTGVIITTTAATAVGSVTDMTATMWFSPLGTSGFYSGGTFVLGGRTLNILFGEQTAGPSSGDLNYFLVQYYVGSTLYEWRSTIQFNTNESHHVAFVVNSTTAVGTLYINGIDRTGTRTSLASVPLTPVESYGFTDAAYQQVCLFTSMLAQGQIQEIIKYSNAQFKETTTARFNRIISQTPFPSALTSAPASPASTVLDITSSGAYVSPELRKVAASEGAPIFVSKTGVLTMYQQNQQFSQSRSIVSQVTYGTGGSDMGQIFKLMPDGDSIRNVANVQMSQGGFFSKRNASSITAYGTSSTTVETQVDSATNARQIGDITTGWGGQVYPRLSPVEVVLDPSSNWAPTMGLELMDRITVNAQPPNGGNAITIPMLVQTIKHRAEPGFWETTLEGSARWAAVFILNKSTLGGTDLLG